MWGGVGRHGSKKCKPIPAPPRGAGLKSRPIPAPPPLRGGENPHGAKRGGAGQAGRSKTAIPSPHWRSPFSSSKKKKKKGVVWLQKIGIFTINVSVKFVLKF